MEVVQPVKKPKYTPESLKEAVSLVKGRKLSAYKAAKDFGIPKSTILDHVKERYPDKPPGPSRMLDEDEEEALVDYIKYMARHGFPPRRSDVRLTIMELIKRKKQVSLLAKEGPSDKWFRKFLSRHDELREKVPQIRQRARSAMTNQQVIDEFFIMYKELLTTLGLEGKASQIFNCDETGFAAKDRAREKAIGLYKEDCIQDEVMTVDHVTAHVTISAAGRVLPTMIIFQGSLPARTYSEDVPEDWLYATSKAGYMDRELFLAWFVDIFIPNCGNRRPVLLILDNHDTHIHVDVIDKAKENEIEILALLPHTTHILQPLDVMFFGPVKRQVYKNARSMCLANTNMTINRRLLPKVLSTTLNQVCSPAFVQSSFSKAGLVPCDASAVDKEKLRPSGKTQQAAATVDTGREDDSLLCPTCGLIDYPHPVFMVRQLDKSLQGAFPALQDKAAPEKRKRLTINHARHLTGGLWSGKIHDARDKELKDKEDLETRKQLRINNREKKIAEKEERKKVADAKKAARDEKKRIQEAEAAAKKANKGGKNKRKRPAPPSESDSDSASVDVSAESDIEPELQAAINKDICAVCHEDEPPMVQEQSSGEEGDGQGQVDWLACDECDQWFHLSCLTATDHIPGQDFVCDHCNV